MKKTLVLILFLTTVITNAQDYQYFKATFDSNNAFQLVENTRNGSKSGGLDFDIETEVIPNSERSIGGGGKKAFTKAKKIYTRCS